MVPTQPSSSDGTIDLKHRHPEQADRTVWEVFEEERPRLVPYAGPFDGFHSVPASVAKTCTVRFDVSGADGSSRVLFYERGDDGVRVWLAGQCVEMTRGTVFL